MYFQSQVGTLADALIHAENRPREAAAEHRAAEFTIAISRQAGARGTSVAHEIGKRLGWPVYDHELLEQLARELHVNVRELEAADERPGNWVTEWAESLSNSRNVNELTYVLHLRPLLLALSQRGACVIVGRGAAHLLPPSSTLRVRLVAPLPDRIAYLARVQGRSATEVARNIDTTERERVRFVREHFHFDPSDPVCYDLVLNAGTLSVPDCASMVLEALRIRKAGRPEPTRVKSDSGLPLSEMTGLVDTDAG